MASGQAPVRFFSWMGTVEPPGLCCVFCSFKLSTAPQLPLPGIVACRFWDTPALCSWTPLNVLEGQGLEA